MDEKQLISFIIDNSQKISLDQLTGSDVLLSKIRKDVFVPKQKLSVIRTWFKMVPNVMLTDEELNITKKIIVKPKSVQWSIILLIIINQKLSNSKIEEWFSYIHNDDKQYASFEIIKNNNLQNDDFKIKLFKDLLNVDDYIPKVIQLVDMFINLGGIWEKLFFLMVDIINNNNELSQKIVVYWTKTMYLDIFAKKKDIKSNLLFTETKKEQYLQTQAVDIFLF